MKNISLFFIFFLLLSAVNLSAAEISNQHRLCQSDDECVVIGRGGCCKADESVNKKFASQLTLPRKEKCNVMMYKCLEVEVYCEENICRKRIVKLINKNR